MARFWRMRGREVFYPVGWDDNGLPTERRVQNYYGVTCDPTLPYDPNFAPRDTSAKSSAKSPARPTTERPATARVAVSRRNFIELCCELTDRDERAFEQAWRRIGLSVDWSMSYRTIDDGPTAVSQRAFLRALAAGEAYQAQGPVLWDVTFGTAVAQAEIEDRDVAGSYWWVAFGIEGDQPTEVVVATTRPELLPACVALVAHPDDIRYRDLFEKNASTPIFGVSVPILAHHLADPAKGTGLAMVCTFGDTTDVTWWRDLRLPVRPVIGPDGRLLAAPPEAITSRAGRAAYSEVAGLSAAAARRRLADLLAAAGALRDPAGTTGGGPEPVVHPVKFYEHGEQPLEIISARQWFVRNGAADPELRDALVRRGQELRWHPRHMRARYENWVHGLTGDWLVSRQRYFGVPVPVWYPVRDDGAPDYGSPIVPPDEALPVDAAAEPPPGYDEASRDQPGGFTGDPDILDTWATSSLTPQIAGGWSRDDQLFAQVFPMDLRPQAHEIIRTWLFYTVLRSQALTGVLPWQHAAISGWIVDPDRKKMSKSTGNVVTPADMLSEYGSDAVRYWAGSARLGVDTTFDLAQFKVGRRLAIKILNATRFVLSFGPPGQGDALVPITEPLDLAMLERLSDVVQRCTSAFENYDHALALELAEQFFWQFCDDYLELVKPRAYARSGGPPEGAPGPGGAGSSVAALRLSLSVLLRLLAPVLPFVTEEAWSWWHEGSIHRAPWPDPAELGPTATKGPALSDSARSGGIALARLRGDGAGLDAASAAIAAIRKAKSQARLPQKADVALLTIAGPREELDVLFGVLPDVLAAGHVAQVELLPADSPEMRYDVSF